jgi:hypothetical protein
VFLVVRTSDGEADRTQHLEHGEDVNRAKATLDGPVPSLRCVINWNSSRRLSLERLQATFVINCP